MNQASVRIDRKNKTVTIVMQLEKPHPSRSTGKTRVIASTGGLRTSEESYSRRPVCFTAHVFFFPPTSQSADGDEQLQVADETTTTRTKKGSGQGRSIG